VGQLIDFSDASRCAFESERSSMSSSVQRRDRPWLVLLHARPSVFVPLRYGHEDIGTLVEVRFLCVLSPTWARRDFWNSIGVYSLGFYPNLKAFSNIHAPGGGVTWARENFRKRERASPLKLFIRPPCGSCPDLSMSDGISPSPVPTTQPSTSTEVAEQGQPPEEAPPTEEEPLKDLPHVPSNQTGQIVDEKGTTAGEGSVDQSADRPAETTGAKDMDADMDLGEGTSNPAPDERSGSDPVPSTKEPKSAFIKIMELGEKDMLKAYLEAFFGESHNVWKR